MELAGARIRLRQLALEDLPEMMIWNCDDEVQFYVDCDLPGNLAELKLWYQTSVSDPNYRIFIIQTLTGQIIGDLELDHICWSKREAELRIRIGAKDFWGQGFGREAIALILENLFTQKNFTRIYLRVYHFNERAIRCYSKIGFRRIGILKRNCPQWKNIILMEISREQFRNLHHSPKAG
jgi:RimJ/RimL family protein N-acetyltransferase